VCASLKCLGYLLRRRGFSLDPRIVTVWEKADEKRQVDTGGDWGWLH